MKQDLLEKMDEEPTTIRSSRLPGTNIPGVTTHGFNRPGFELTFDFSHNCPSLEMALQDVLRMASAVSRHWNLYFCRDGTVEGKAEIIPGKWSPSLHWTLSPNAT